jgi:hypothetical protein
MGQVRGGPRVGLGQLSDVYDAFLCPKEIKS